MDQPNTKYPPGDLAIWFIVIAELLVFGIFFVVYAFARLKHVELFNQYQLTLDRDYAVVNTIALLTASYFVVRAIHAIRASSPESCVRWMVLACLMALVFLLVKSVEFYQHGSAGISLSTNLFYMFYLSLTFFHFMHVLLGLVILVILTIVARRGGYSASNHRGMETGASYWHMVDLIWLILFPLIYVMR